MSRYRCVIFDCDSTLSTIEGIEVLAAAHREEVAALTDAAMRGALPLEQVYGRRLDLVRPTREAVAALGRRYVETLVPDAAEVVGALRAEGVDVRIISGGLRPAVVALGHALGVADRAIAAVDVYFDDAGEYAGFDRRSVLARSGGKREQIELWGPTLPRPVMLVGDGATDLEARPAVDCFVAFAGVVERPAIVAQADVALRGPSLAPVLPLVFDAVAPRSAAARATYEAGIAQLAAHDPRRSPTSPRVGDFR
jgi:phosphoserine phosphatase